MTEIETLDEILESLNNIEDDHRNSTIDQIVVRKGGEDNKYEIGQIYIEESMRKRLAELASEDIDEKLDKEFEYSEYSASNLSKDKNLVQHEEFSNLPHSSELDLLFDREQFDDDDYDSTYDIEFHAFRFQLPDEDEHIIAFQNFSGKQVLSKASLGDVVLGKIRNSEDSTIEYEHVNRKLVALRDQVDAIAYDDTIYLFDQRRFEDMFHYHDKFQTKAQDVVSNLREGEIPITEDALDTIDNAIDMFPNAARLFYNVEELGEYKEWGESEIREIDNRFDTDVDFVEEDGDLQITLEEEFHVWRVLRLLNDSHLSSPISESQYLSLSKESADPEE
jgi:hypothetical protein